MMIIKKAHHFILWQDGKQFVVTTNKRNEVYRGTETECNQYIDSHPYGKD